MIKADHWAYEQKCLHLHYRVDSRADIYVGYQSTLSSSRCRNKRIYDWHSLVLEALRKLLM